MQKTTIYLPDELASSISTVAKRCGTSKAWVIREALTTYVATIEPPKLKSAGMISSGELQSDDVEEWLAKHWPPK
jgi:predicted transcriptional regulator